LARINTSHDFLMSEHFGFQDLEDDLIGTG